jgi:hypothetical protein
VNYDLESDHFQENFVSFLSKGRNWINYFQNLDNTFEKFTLRFDLIDFIRSGKGVNVPKSRTSLNSYYQDFVQFAFYPLLLIKNSNFSLFSICFWFNYCRILGGLRLNLKLCFALQIVDFPIEIFKLSDFLVRSKQLVRWFTFELFSKFWKLNNMICSQKK